MKHSILKKLLLTGIASVTILFGTANAIDSLPNLKFYAGTGADYIKYRIDDTKVTGGGIWTPIVGMKICNYFGLEAGYGFHFKPKVVSKYIDVKHIYLDAMGFYPVHNRIDLIAGIGMGKFTVKKGKKEYPGFSAKNKFNWRAKIGVDCNVISQLTIRCLVGYQKSQNKFKITGFKESTLKHMKYAGLHILWTF